MEKARSKASTPASGSMERLLAEMLAFLKSSESMKHHMKCYVLFFAICIISLLLSSAGLNSYAGRFHLVRWRDSH